jgi:hypothetical protein
VTPCGDVWSQSRACPCRAVMMVGAWRPLAAMCASVWAGGAGLSARRRPRPAPVPAARVCVAPAPQAAAAASCATVPTATQDPRAIQVSVLSLAATSISLTGENL